MRSEQELQGCQMGPRWAPGIPGTGSNLKWHGSSSSCRIAVAGQHTHGRIVRKGLRRASGDRDLERCAIGEVRRRAVARPCWPPNVGDADAVTPRTSPLGGPGQWNLAVLGEAPDADAVNLPSLLS